MATFSERFERLSLPPRRLTLAVCGIVILVGIHIVGVSVAKQASRTAAELRQAAGLSDETAQALSEAQLHRDIHVAELNAFKVGLPKLTESRRALYEGGLQLQEEKRLLEKQLEIMTTYLMIDEDARKIHIMRGEQSLESFNVADAPAEVCGNESRDQPAIAPIVSKERFAHPERPKAEQVDGQLQWEPPQVGASVRANALGEFVVFTKGPLILHGPPKKPEEHKEFPHQCLGLSLPVARKLYAKTYIGTKVQIKPRTPSRWNFVK